MERCDKDVPSHLASSLSSPLGGQSQPSQLPRSSHRRSLPEHEGHSNLAKVILWYHRFLQRKLARYAKQLRSLALSLDLNELRQLGG